MSKAKVAGHEPIAKGAIIAMSDNEIEAYAAPKVHGQVIEAKDIDIPNIYVVQSNSTAALERDIQPGSLAGAGGATVFAKAKESFEFVPLAFRRVWDIYRLEGEKKVWVEQQAYTPDNSNAPWEWDDEGIPYMRQQKVHIICMEKSAITKEAGFMEAIKKGEVPEMDDFGFPVCLSIKGASMKTAAKVIFTHFAQVDNFNGIAPPHMAKPYHCRSFKTHTTLEKKNDNKFFVVHIEKDEMLSPSELSVLSRWEKIVNSGAVNVVDSDVTEPDTDGIPF